jgi:hypothetical protein
MEFKEAVEKMHAIFHEYEEENGNGAPNTLRFVSDALVLYSATKKYVFRIEISKKTFAGEEKRE